jgi:hypothetical protein
MSCTTCSHTCHRLSADGVFWCPRCGTVRFQQTGMDSRPKLVELAHHVLFLLEDMQRELGGDVLTIKRFVERAERMERNLREAVTVDGTTQEPGLLSEHQAGS